MRRYHPVTVILHWATAFVILAMLFMGQFVMSPMENSDPEKLSLLSNHRLAGIIVLVLTVGRLIFMARKPRPPHARTGNGVLDRLGPIVQYGMIGLVFGMIASGLALWQLSGLGAVMAGEAPMPESFMGMAPRMAHGVLAKLLMALVALHVLGALYHQFVLKDGLFGRLWFGRD